MDESFLKGAHQHSFQSRKEIEKSNLAGCFCCKEIYPAKEVKEWVPDQGGNTPECLECGIDSVIGDASGIEVSKEFLEAMHEFWFERTIPFEEPAERSTIIREESQAHG